MILQALNRYYERGRARGELLPEGFEQKEIPFIVVIDANGGFLQIDDTRRGEGKKLRARSFAVPQGVKKTSGIAANLLWDTAEYVLGVDTRGKPDRVAEQHAEFKKRVARLAGTCDDPGLLALLRFLQTLSLPQLEKSPWWAEICEHNPLLSFRLASDPVELVCQRAAVLAALSGEGGMDGEGEAGQGLCLVRGETDLIARLHPAIKGVWGAQTSGANIVSFNLAAFNSYAKEQGANAPVGQRAAFNYTSALNHLLHKDSRQRLQVGSTSTVFWAAEKVTFESTFADLFGFSAREDDASRGAEALRELHAATRHGVYRGDDGDTQFHVLGLAPNAARIAVRFWRTGLVRDFAVAVEQHFTDLEIVRAPFEREHLPLFRLLVSVATLGKAENIPPALDGDFMRAILDATPYPALLLQAAVRRCRAEREITYPRAALLKATLNRLIRTGRLAGKELSVGLDTDNREPAYRLGRLFAALERIQSVAQPGINATIRDRYYGAASSVPGNVFPVLLKLKNHHLSKISRDKSGLAIWFEQQLADIFDGMSAFPARLALPEQGLFAIGYYHQQQHFFAARDGSEAASTPEEPTKD